MKRVLIIGCPGAGKSTFGRKLAEKTGLPLHYLDMIWHKADRTTVTRDEFDEKLAAILHTDEWIIDGNYMRTLPDRLGYADTVFFLDYPIDVCLQGAIGRLGKPRPDIPWNSERDSELDEEFRQWIIDYPKDQIPAIKELLNIYQGQLHVFKNREEAKQFLDDIQL